MTEKKQIFRNVALDRLSSPEQLDQVLQVTTPKGWLALLTISGFIIVVLVWAIFGSIPTKVQGTGIFISGGAVRDISAPTSGEVTTVYINPGEFVERGQIVARIAQPELITGISQARFRKHELLNHKQELRSFIESARALQAEQNFRQISRLDGEISNLKEQLINQEERLDNQQKLLESGLITRQQFLETKDNIQSLEQKIIQLTNEKLQIPLATLQLHEEHEQRLREKDKLISDAQLELESIQERMEEASMVYSPHSGRILEVPATEGVLVRQGARIASLEQIGDEVDLVGILYIPADHGKRVQAGMRAHMSPSTVRQEEDGSMLGMVTQAGTFPATREGMLRILRNDLLVEQLSQEGSPIEIFVSPIPSPDTYSGYRWTSPGGPRKIIQSGTITTGSIVVERQPPISLVIPWLRKQALGIGLD